MKTINHSLILPKKNIIRFVPKKNGRNAFFRQLGLCILIVIGVNACRSHKTAVTTTTPESTAFRSSCYPIESITVPKCKLEIFDGKKSLSLNGSIYIRPDSICYFSGKWLFFEMRGVIYRDSFAVVNYMDRVCYKGKNDYLQKITGYPVTPQSLLMLFTADRCEKVYKEEFDFMSVTGKSDKIMMQGKNRSLLEMSINTDDQTVENIVLYNSRQRQAIFSATYSRYNQYEQFTLPTVFDISAHDGKNPIRIKADFQQILFNQPQQINFNIPSKYKIVTLQ